MDYSSQKAIVHRVLDTLCNQIGSRAVGSQNNLDAQSFIAGLFAGFGLQVQMQEFECIDWEKTALRFRVDNAEIPAEISPYSLGVSVSSEFVVVKNISELENANPEKAVMVLAGDLTQEAIMPKNFRFWNPEHHQEIIRILEDKKPEAIVTVSFSRDLPIPIFEDGDFDIPSIVVAGKFLEDIENAKRISIEFEAKRKESSGANVIARSGKGKKVVVTAHLDTKPDTPGALDNASGIAVLALLGALCQDCGIELELVALNGEDYYSNPGQIAYLDEYSSQFDELQLVINCDGVGYVESETGISLITKNDELDKIIKELLPDYQGLVCAEPWFQGDHAIFINSKAPIIAITSQKIFDIIDSIIHTENDTIELVDIDKIIETADFINSLIGYHAQR